MVERISNTVCHYVCKLAGPDHESITVIDLENKMNFKMWTWLDRFTDMFLFFQHNSQFLEAVVKDERSYKPEVFAEAMAILQNKHLSGKPPEKLKQFQAFLGTLNRVEEQVCHCSLADSLPTLLFWYRFCSIAGEK